MLTQENYMNQAGLICPQCKSENIEPEGDEELDAVRPALVSLQRMSCHGCGATWNDAYTHTGYESFKRLKDKP